jgi:hypothetical protein
MVKSNSKIDIDNNTRFRYQVGYWCPLIDTSICGASAEADTQSSIFGSSAWKKQYLIFLFRFRSMIRDPAVTVESFQFSPAEPVAYEWSPLVYLGLNTRN